MALPVTGGQAKIRVSSLTGTSSTNNAATRSTGAGAAGGYVQVDSTAKRHLDRNSTGHALYLTALGSTNLVSSTAYSINYVQGKFEWPAGTDPATGVYTADVVAHTNTYLARGRSWQANFDVSMYDVTSFATSATGVVLQRSFAPGLTEGTVSITKFISSGDTGPLFFDRLNLEADYIIELITDGTNRFEGYGLTSVDNIDVGVDQVTVESVEFMLDGPLYWSTG